MSLHPRRRSLGGNLALVVWLTAVWALIWGDPSIGTVLAGLGLAVLVTRIMPLPRVHFAGRLHVVPALYLLVRFVADLVVASVQVSYQALRPRRLPRSAVLAVHLRSHSDLYLTLTAELCSLVPGSIVVEAHRASSVLYVHILDVDMAGGIEAARTSILDTEARILRALASNDELAAAGLSRNPRQAVGHPGLEGAPSQQAAAAPHSELDEEAR